MKVQFLSFILIFCLVSMKIKAQNDTTSKENVQTVDTSKYMEKADSLIEVAKKHIETYNEADAELNTYIDKYDKLYTRDLELLIVRVKGIDEKYVKFNYPLNTKLERISKDEVSQIFYSDGKRDIYFLPDTLTEEAESSGLLVKEEKDWTTIEVIENEEEIDASYMFIEKIQSFYEADRINANTKFLEKNAIIILKRRAASLGGSTIVLTDKDVSRAYGELPKIRLTAKVYSKDEE